MSNAQIATAVVLRELKCTTLDTIQDRILLQKKVYLAQDKGLPLGYGYSWYIHGPYSTDLTSVAYQVIPEGFGSIEGNKLKEKYAAIVSKVNAIEDTVEEQKLKIGVVQWYELVASIAYWSNLGITKKEAMIAKMEQSKPQFSSDQVEAAYETYLTFKDDERGVS